MEEFTLEKLDSLLKKVEEKKKKDLEDQKMKNFTDIIEGVAGKYASKWVDYEDLKQDLWLRVWALIQDCGGILNTDENLVARIAYNKAVDVYRYQRRRYESNVAFIEEWGGESDDSASPDKSDSSLGIDDYFDALHTKKFETGYDRLLIKELIRMFKPGSKERKYVVAKLVMNGLIQMEDLDESDIRDFKRPNGDNEEDYLLVIGYTSHYPGSWNGKKWAMKKIIHEYLAP